MFEWMWFQTFYLTFFYYYPRVVEDKLRTEEEDDRGNLSSGDVENEVGVPFSTLGTTSEWTYSTVLG